MSAPDWVSQYIGVPFKELGRDPEEGLDCWGLCRHFWNNYYGLDVPSYTTEYDTTKREDVVAEAIDRGIQDEWHEVEEPKEADGIVLNLMGRPIHIGFVLDDHRFVHVFRGINTTVADYTSSRWDNRREGFYRHEDLF